MKTKTFKIHTAYDTVDYVPIKVKRLRTALRALFRGRVWIREDILTINAVKYIKKLQVDRLKKESRYKSVVKKIKRILRSKGASF